MSNSSEARIADAVHGNWVRRYLPDTVVPYAELMRLDRPIGWWLLLLPCWWGLALAHVARGEQFIDIRYAVLFFAGAVVMRGAGCVLNDIVDQDFDAKVERTRQRPIASGRVSTTAASVFLVILLLLGLLILLQFNWYTVLLTAGSLLIVAVYPFMKRVTYYPQFFLGLAFNWGALVGWAALWQSVGLAPVLLYAGGVAWTLAYDTIYAHQDKEDDVLIGVKSTALKFGDQTPWWLIGFFGISLLLIAAAFRLAGVSWTAYLFLAFAAAHATWQIAQFDGNASITCLKLFKSNRTFGLLVLAGLVLDILS